jgi:Ras-related protein Rap-1B
MRDAQGFLLVFSITSLSSLQELAELRSQIINVKNDPYVPIVLVGNKSDLEEDRMVSRSRAFALSQEWGSVPYYETSARRRQNVTEVFVDVCRQIIRKDLEKARVLHAAYERDDGRHHHTFGRPKRRRRRHDDDYDDRHRRNRCVIL